MSYHNEQPSHTSYPSPLPTLSTTSLSHNEPHHSINNSHSRQPQYDLNYEGGAERFCYRLWWRDAVLRAVGCFRGLFEGVGGDGVGVRMELGRLLPSGYKGATIQLCCRDELKLYHACLHLFTQLTTLQKSLSPTLSHPHPHPQPLTLTLLLPRMLVPVLMGKEGKLITLIKTQTRTNILVYGPYSKYIYQNIEISSDSVEDIVSCCFVVYGVVFRVLRGPGLRVGGIGMEEGRIGIGVGFKGDVCRMVFEPYYRYVRGLEEDLNVQVVRYPSRDGRETVLMVSGRLQQVKSYLTSIFQLLDFESQLGPVLTLLITQAESKLLTSNSGKHLREISNKSQNSFIEIYGKEGQEGRGRDRERQRERERESRVVIRGSLEGRIAAVRMIVEFLAFGSRVERRGGLVDYQKEVFGMLGKVYGSNGGHYEQQDNEKKTKPIKKKKKHKKRESHRNKLIQSYKKSYTEMIN